MGQMGSAPFASTRRRRRDGGAFSPLALYANGEAGGWYDPSDLTPEKVSWRRNLLTYSEQFDNSAWTKSNASITANAGTAPDGSATADKLVENTANNAHYMAQSYTTIASAYTVSVHLKAEGRSWAAVELQGIGFAYVNLSTGVIGGNSGLTASNVTAVGNGWYRLVMTLTASAGARAINVYTASADNTASYAGDGTSGILVWGAQLELAPTASSYQRITDFTSDFLAAFPQHALYQDGAGTTPVTALGQPVGLVLDKSKGGLASTTRISTNESFDSGSTGWSAQSGWTISGGQASVNSSVAGTTMLRTTAATVSGAMYRISFTVVSMTSGFLNAVASSTTAPAISAAGNYTFYVTANGTAGAGLSASGTTTVAVIDNLTVDLVPGAHAIQATSASRPTCDARVNLLTYSEQLENAYWAKLGASVTANATLAPDGTTTADKLVEDSSTGQHAVYKQTLTASGTTVTLSCYVKKAERTWCAISDTVLFTAYVNLDTGTFGTQSNVLSSSIQNVGNGWYRVSVTGTSNSASSGIGVYLASADNTASYAGNGTSGIFVWGADLRIASDASLPYQRVVTASDYADVQAPRYLTFDGIDDSLYTAASVDFATWTSGTRRNLLTYPSAFDNAVWDKGSSTTVTANAGTAPNGTTTAERLQIPATSGSFIKQAVSVTNGTVYTFSFYANPLAGSVVNVGFAADATGPISVSDSGPITIASGWNRYVYQVTSNTTGTLWITIDNNGNTTSCDMLLWGAQLELGSTATAFQDVGTDKMTVVTGVRRLSDAALGLLVELSANLGSNNGTFGLFAPSSPANVYVYEFDSRGTTTRDAQATGTAAPVTGVVTGLGDISGDIASVRVNGTVASTNTGDQGSGTYGTYVLYVGRRNNASNPFNGRLYQLIVRGAQTDTATVQQTERFVAGKTGVTL